MAELHQQAYIQQGLFGFKMAGATGQLLPTSFYFGEMISSLVRGLD